MNQEEFLKKLSEVAEWHWEKHRGATYMSHGRNEKLGPEPEYIQIDKIKPQPCPYGAEPKIKPGRKNAPWERSCFWKGEIVELRGHRFLQQRCSTCGALMTPKGTWIEPPEHYRYSELIWSFIKKGK